MASPHSSGDIASGTEPVWAAGDGSVLIDVVDVGTGGTDVGNVVVTVAGGGIVVVVVGMVVDW
jgi:hypothetical protein